MTISKPRAPGISSLPNTWILRPGRYTTLKTAVFDRESLKIGTHTQVIDRTCLSAELSVSSLSLVRKVSAAEASDHESPL